jgi:hypothetical protein
MGKILGNGVNSPAEYGQTETDLVRRLGDEQMRDRALGDGGNTRGGSLAGKQNAVYSEVNLTGLTSLADVKVPHALGSRPVTIRLEGARNAGTTPSVIITPVHEDKWTKTTARVSVALVGASVQAGTVLKFRVGGA